MNWNETVLVYPSHPEGKTPLTDVRYHSVYPELTSCLGVEKKAKEEDRRV